MGGETQDNISAWTIDSLHEHFRKQMDERDRRYTEQFASQEKAVAAALAASEKASTKADIATEKRFEGVNEFRKTLSDQTQTFIPRREYDTAHDALAEKVDDLRNRITVIEANKEGASSDRKALYATAGIVCTIILFSIAVFTFVK